MKEASTHYTDRRLTARLARTRAVVGCVLYLERLWPLLLPLAAVVMLFFSVSWFGVFRDLPANARMVLAGVFLLAALASLVPLRLFRRPSAFEIDRRIERANRLEHQPLGVQEDRPGGEAGAFANALWREHQKRMAARLERLSADMPRTPVPERDPWALRAIPVLLLFVAFAFSTSPLGGRLGDAFRPNGGREAVPPRIDAWVTPPAYTGKAPIFLTADTGAGHFSVPDGSKVDVRVTGGAGNETLALARPGEKTQIIKSATPKSGDDASKVGVRQFVQTLHSDGRLSLRENGDTLRSWGFTVVADRPPVIHFAGAPRHAANGALELAYSITDDYGATSAKAEFRQAVSSAPGAHPLYGPPDLPLALPLADARNHVARTTRDLSEHPWAGSMVKLTLEATDGAGHEAVSETRTLEMPQRPFSNPLARAVIEQRRILALDATRKNHVLDMMDAVLLRPEDTIPSMAQYLALVSARTRLKLASTDNQYRGEVDYLWQVALGIEAGDLSTAEMRLHQAEAALKQALKNGANDQEIDKLMQNLRQAMSNYLHEFAQNARKNENTAQQQPQDGKQIGQDDLQRMLDQIQNLAKSGSRDKAQQLLSQLQDMMNNLRAARNGQGGQGQSEMRKQMDKLGNLMRQQQEMMNETFSLNQKQQGQREPGNGDRTGQDGGVGQDGQSGEGGQKPGAGHAPGGMTSDQLAQALRQLRGGQDKLRSDLGDLTQNLQRQGIRPGEGFGDAGKAMGRAGKALGQAEGDRAVGEQGQALEALRRGANDMMKQIQQAARGDRGGSQNGGREQDADRDPLGRPRASTGPDFGDSVKVPDAIDVQRARQILEAIRKRLGDALSPQIEKSYLERLLDLK